MHVEYLKYKPFGCDICKKKYFKILDPKSTHQVQCGKKDGAKCWARMQTSIERAAPAPRLLLLLVACNGIELCV